MISLGSISGSIFWVTRFLANSWRVQLHIPLQDYFCNALEVALVTSDVEACTMCASNLDSVQIMTITREKRFLVLRS